MESFRKHRRWALLAIIELSLISTPCAAAQQKQAETSTRTPAATTTATSPKADQAPQAPKVVKTIPVSENEGGETMFDALLGADSYTVYAEARMIGRQLSSSSTAGEILRSLAQLRLMPAEMKPFVSFITAHADQLANSRLSVATMPASNRSGLPQTIIAVDFASADEARELEPELRRFFSTLAPRPNKTTATAPGKQQSGAVSAAAAFHLTRKANLLLLSEHPFEVSALKSKDGLALSEEPRFQALRARLASEQLFVYAATGIMKRNLQREIERQTKLREEQEKTARDNALPNEKEDEAATSIAEAEATIAAAAQPSEQSPTAADEPVSPPPQDATAEPPVARVDEPGGMRAATDVMNALPMMLFGGFMAPAETRWPEAVGTGLQLDGDMLALRVLLTDGLHGKTSLIPMLSFIEPGPALSMQASAYAPEDTELLIGGSLNLPRVFDSFGSMIAGNAAGGMASMTVTDQSFGRGIFENQIAALEAKYGFKIREQLLPALGGEVAVSMPLNDIFPRVGGAHPNPTADAQRGPVFYFSLQDKSGLKEILPRVLEALGAKSADEQSAIETKGDAEIYAYRGAAVAFIDNFLVLGTNAQDVYRVIEADHQRQTLGGKKEFTDATSWAPPQKLGYAYLSEALMKKMFADTQRSVERADEITRNFYGNLNKEALPITYAVSTESAGVLHELRFPKSLVMTLVAAGAAETNKLPLAKNEEAAISELRQLYWAQSEYRERQGQGNYGTLDQLIQAHLLPALARGEQANYHLDVSASGAHFQATATPQIYGKTGQRSYFVDETGIIRGGDTGGNRATVTEAPVQ